MQKIVRYITRSGKPWLLLVPNNVYVKEWYRSAVRRVAAVTSRAADPFYILQTARYYYYAPKGLGIANAKGTARKAKETKTSPFISFWYVGGLGVAGTAAAIQAWQRAPSAPAATLAQSSAALPQNVMDEYDPNRKKLSKREREKLRKKVSRDGKPLCKTCGQIWGNCRHTKT